MVLGDAFFQAKKWLILIGILVMTVYCPNAFYKMKWNTAEKVAGSSPRQYKPIIGACTSIPTSFWTTLAMNVMVYVDFLVSSLMPFVIMIVFNIIIVKKLFDNRMKVILIVRQLG